MRQCRRYLSQRKDLTFPLKNNGLTAGIVFLKVIVTPQIMDLNVYQYSIISTDKSERVASFCITRLNSSWDFPEKRDGNYNSGTWQMLQTFTKTIITKLWHDHSSIQKGIWHQPRAPHILTKTKKKIKKFITESIHKSIIIK